MEFYDTSSLLLKINDLNKPFAISSITLQELEEIKTSSSKDAEIKYAARKILHTLEENPELCKVFIFNNNMLSPCEDQALQINNDMRILMTAYAYKNEIDSFITNDLALKYLAKIFFDDNKISSIQENFEDDYKGYLDTVMTNEQMEIFYSNLQKNSLNAKINQYIIIRDMENNIIDRRCWTGNEYRNLKYENFDSLELGVIKPMSNDVYQQFVADSFYHNKITMVKGPAGTGKSQLSLGFLFNQLEKHKIDKIIIFCNTVAARGAAKLGYYPGSRSEKLLDSQIGNFLLSKLGDKLEVERLIEDNKILLLPMADIRGFDTTNMRAGVYITEAQNLDINLMKLALQRIGEDSICIIDGDEKTQVDDISFAGMNNGMRRVSKIFRGQNFYSEIELKKIYRSKIAAVAENM